MPGGDPDAERARPDPEPDRRVQHDCLAVDAQSRLLWRFPPRRLEMEPIRDSILAVSGALDLSMGGPDMLQQIPITEFKEIRYLSATDATQRFGTGHTAGAIIVTRK